MGGARIKVSTFTPASLRSSLQYSTEAFPRGTYTLGVLFLQTLLGSLENTISRGAAWLKLGSLGIVFTKRFVTSLLQSNAKDVLSVEDLFYSPRILSETDGFSHKYGPYQGQKRCIEPEHRRFPEFFQGGRSTK